MVGRVEVADLVNMPEWLRERCNGSVRGWRYWLGLLDVGDSMGFCVEK